MQPLLIDRFPELFLHNVLVFGHFVAAAFALSSLLSIDVRFLRGLHKPLPMALLQDLHRVERVVWISLGLLYATGILFVAIGSSTNPNYLSNEKLQAKIMIVGALTLNGFLVRGIIGRLKSGDIVASLPFARRMTMSAVAAISSTSWLWACFLGIARNWNFKMPLLEIGMLYGASLVLMLAVITATLSVVCPKETEVTIRTTMRRKPRHIVEAEPHLQLGISDAAPV